jgi:serine/threonine-protein kinase HipA
VAYSYKPGSAWVNAHQLSLNGKRDKFTRTDLLSAAQLIGNFSREAEEIIEQVLAVVSRWKDYARKVAVDKKLAQEIENNLRLDL